MSAPGAIRGLVATHPRHAVLAAAVAGLLLGPRAPAALGGVALLCGLVSPGRVGLAAVAIAITGGVVAQARIAALERTALGPDIGHVVAERAVLLEAPRPAPFGGASALASVRGEPVLLRTRGRARWPAGAGAGDIVAVRGALRSAGSFARVRHAHAELAAEELGGAGARGGWAGAVDGVRRRAERALRGHLPPPLAGLLRGMVLGQDAALADADREDFRAAGLSHLTAASGQNVVLLSALVLAAAVALGLGLYPRWLLVLGLIALYVPLAGGGPSIQRAGVMGAAGVVAVLAGRPASRWYALGLAAVATLVIDPRAAADPGWQMSFAAVVGLLALAARWRDALQRRGIPRGAAEALAVTAAATLATAPLIAWHFERLSLVSIPANVLAAPAVAPIMWLGLLAAGVGQLAPAPAGVLADLAGYPLGYLVWLGHAAAHAPLASVAAGPLAVGAGCLALVVAIAGRPAAGWGMALTGRSGGAARRRALAVIAAGAAPLLVVVALALGGRSAGVPPPAGLRVTFLDVGQGDATLVQDGRRAILVDTGPADGGVVARLHRAGVRRLDLLTVTHAQADHDGGAAAVLRAMPVGAVLDGRDGVPSADGSRMAAEIARRRVRRLVPDAGEVLRAGALTLRVLSPRREAPALHAGADPNQRAIVAEVSAHGARVLLTADAESDALGGVPLRSADVLKVAHHGSSDPGLPGLLARIRPRVAVIEVGAHNTYGHPAPSTLAALATVPATYRTDRDGSVRLDLVGGAWRVRTHA